MEQKDKKGEKSQFSIKTTFLKWLSIEGLQNAQFILGNTYSGKTTISLLHKQTIDKYQDSNFKLVQKKKDFEYQYEGQINPKSTKPLTIYPKLYRLQSANTNIVEVPSRIYQPQKKRLNLDRLLNVIGLYHTTKKARFLFCVDTKNTTGRCGPWIQSFQSIFDNFNQEFLTEDSFRSIGFIITKGAADTNQQTYINRMNDIYQLLKDNPRKDIYTQLLKSTQSNKRIQVFTKASSTSFSDGQQNIRRIFEFSKKLPYIQLKIKNQQRQQTPLLKMQTVNLVKEQQILYNKFQQSLQMILSLFAQLFKTLFSTTQPIDIEAFINKNSQIILNIKKKILSQDQKIQYEEIKVIHYQYNKLLQQSSQNNNYFNSLIGKASFLFQYKQKIQKPTVKNYQTLHTLLNILAQHGFIIQNLKSIYCQLIMFSIFQQRFGPMIMNIDYKKLLQIKQVTHQFRQVHQTYVKASFLDSKFSSQQTPQNAKKILNMLEKFFPQDRIPEQQLQKISFIKNIMMLSSFDTRNPRKGLPEIFQLLQKFIYVKKLPQAIYSKSLPNPDREIEFLNKLALLVAQMLKVHGRSDLCAQIFTDCGQYYSAKECLEIKLKQIKQLSQAQNINSVKTTLMSYIDLLVQMLLKQKALQCCFQYAQIYKQLAPQLLGKMKQIHSKSNTFSDQFQKKFLRKGLQLIDFYKNNELLQKIKTVVEKIKKQTSQ